MTPNQINQIIKRSGIEPLKVEINNTTASYLTWVNILDSVFLRHEHYPKGTTIKIYPSECDFAITFES